MDVLLELLKVFECNGVHRLKGVIDLELWE